MRRPDEIVEPCRPLAQPLLASEARQALFVRPEDGVLVVRPNRVYYVNRTAAEMAGRLLGPAPADPAAIVAEIALRYGAPRERVARDLAGLVDGLNRLVAGRGLEGSSLFAASPFGTHRRRFPVLGEIALTYRCQNACRFCYAASPQRGNARAEMTHAQAGRVIDAMHRDARIGTLSFTGGEPTLRPDLPKLIGRARSHGLWVNLITNGIRCAAAGYARRLKDAGLHSAQVSLEGGDGPTHDAAVGRKGAFRQTLEGIEALLDAGIRTHTNTTVHRENAASLPGLIDTVARLGLTKLSMNMVIPAGQAAYRDEIHYGEIGPVVTDLKQRCEASGIRFVWYSPVPFCLFNPIEAGLGSPSCAAADGLLSVAPDGRVLPCSSFAGGLGNLLLEPFEKIWSRPAARYFRDKKFLPPSCRACCWAHICCGACPLYWNERRSFDEIAPHGAPPGAAIRLRWRLRKMAAGRHKGIGH